MIRTNIENGEHNQTQTKLMFNILFYTLEIFKKLMQPKCKTFYFLIHIDNFYY